MSKEDIQKWLSANPLAAMVLARVTVLLLGVVVGLLAAVGLIPAELAACLAASGLKS